ncbi:MAG: FHA domain-containing protein [Kofleriaceae bacterium]
MGCLVCGAEAEVGALCRACALQVEPCEGLIPDHVHSRIDPTSAAAWVVDGFGGAHALGPVVGIGRHHDRDLIVLASSVSREHAELRCGEAGWTARDLGSRNGTFVDGVRGDGPMALANGALLKVGEVLLRFIAEVAHAPARQAMLTMEGGKGRLVRYQLDHGNLELSVVTREDDVGPGSLLWRTAGSASWSERNLTVLEFQLLRRLCHRAQQEASSPSPVRGCVATKQLVSDLPFQSKYANQENVRQVVLRLRNVLAEVGAPGVVAVAPGRGYYLKCRARVATVD